MSKEAQAVIGGDRRALAKAITLMESRRVDQRAEADAMLRALTPHAGKALRIGISGPPGVGKSTFIEAIGQQLLAAGHRIAVLAIDPTSPITGGSILGDRTRMAVLSSDERVFIRPSPTSGTMGGVARRTREAIIACEAAGYDVVLVETVGVGQSEIVAASMVDAFLILHLPNAGDELQGIKRGILELADAVAVTKADGPLVDAAKRAQGELARALMLARGQQTWQVPVRTVSSVEGSGLAEVWQDLESFVATQRASGGFELRRKAQALQWFHDELGEQVRERLLSDNAAILKRVEARVVSGELPGSVAAAEALDAVLSGAGSSASKS